MDDSMIKRAALGRIASFGALYDSRRDDFCGISIFENDVPRSAISSYDANFSDIRLVESDNFFEKATKLEVSAELQVSVLARLFSLKSSARYLNDQKHSARTVKSYLVYNIKTREKFLNINHDDMQGIFAMNAIKSGLGTHFVVGITWGANTILSCTYENKENRYDGEIAGNLSASLNEVALSIDGKAAVETSRSDEVNDVKFKIHVYGDVISKDHLPTTFETAVEFMKQVPELVQSCNHGKGKPLMYYLLPISILENVLKFSLGVDIMIKKLPEESLALVVQMFDQISEVQQKLSDVFEDAKEHRYCVMDEDYKAIRDLNTKVFNQEMSFRSQLRQMLQDIRSGKSDVNQLELFLQEFQSGALSVDYVTMKIMEWNSITKKIRFARRFGENGAKYIGNGTSLDEEMLENCDAMSYVLFFSQGAMTKASDCWKSNKLIFFQELKKQTGQYFIVDCDIHPALKQGDGHSCIQTMQNGKLLVKDFLKTSLVQLVSGTVSLVSRPEKRCPLIIRCTGIYCDPTEKYKWHCRNCYKILEYGYDDHVYCVCGKTPVLCLEFKCADPKHGIKFNRHQEDLQNLLHSKYSSESFLKKVPNCFK